MNFADAVEQGINGQIALELKASHAYLSMAAYFGRDTVALPGLRHFFQKNSDEEREHAQKLIDYQNTRGGRVALAAVPPPEVEWKSARHALETAMQMEKEVNKSLLALHQVADDHNDPQLSDFLEGHFLEEQVESMKELADMLTQLNRVGNDGLGLHIFDRELSNKKK
jgi:ferritin heavy chain